MGDERVATIGSVVINVSDMDRAKAFWMGLLGVGVAREFPGFFCWLSPQHPGGVSLALQASPDPGSLDGRLHIDTGVEDLGAARAQIEALGGSHVEDHEVAGFRWSVMTDPDGNRFCIATEAEG